MSALPIPISLAEQPTKSPPAPRGVMFITLREANLRSGVPIETLARLSRSKWSQINLAAIVSPADGGKPCWHVREDADVRFARVQSPDAIPFDWNKLTERQRSAVQRRKHLLMSWLDSRAADFERGFSERESTEAYIMRCKDDRLDVSRASLYRWLKAYQAAGLAGLLDDRMVHGPRGLFADPFIEAMTNYWLKPKGYTQAMAYRLACEKAEESGWPIPFDLRQAQRILSTIPRKVAAFHREGPRNFNARCGKHVERDYTKLDSNTMWVSDGYTMDVAVDLGDGKLGRPTLVAWMDMCSRYPVGWKIVARAENADVILAAFRMGVRNHGAPEWVYHDNGKAYDATTLQGVSKRGRRKGQLPVIDLGVFSRLEINVRHSLPFNAKAKTNERWHRVIKERFCTRFETYTGGSPDEKPFNLEANKKAGKAPTLDELIEAFKSWLIVDYTMTEHHGADMDGAPAEVFARHLHTKRVIDEGRLMIETGRRELVKVGRNGVRWRGITYQAPELDNRLGETVQIVIDDANVNSVLVLHASGAKQGAELCKATVLQRMDVIATEEDTRNAIAEVRRDTRLVREAGPARMRLRDDPVERLNRLAAKRDDRQHRPSPASLKPISSEGRAIMRLAEESEPPATGTFGIYAQFADDAKAVNE